jgi:DMSO/TMAO reductase YedYZ molybdopterin-dependent catalytic subunit
METHDVSRRALLKGAGATLAGLSVIQVAGSAQAFAGDSEDGQVVPWLDVPPPNPLPQVIVRQLDWEQLDSRLTPQDQFFVVQHYGQPVLSESAYRLGVVGLVANTQSLTLADLKARARQEIEFTLECSGNTGLPFFIGGVGNAIWAGTPLASVLERACVLDDAVEVVFWGADSGPVTIRDNSGVISSGTSGATVPDDSGGLDLTITEQFARSMSVEDALDPDNLLCYEMNGAPLPPEHGFPVRLIAPGWYGVANVKWLTRIEVVDRRYAGRFMARDYVSIREEQRDGKTVWTFSTVGHDRLKSAPAKVTRDGDRYAVVGVAWGAPIAAVEVRIDDGPWIEARLKRQHARRHKAGGRSEFAWRFWTYDWGKPPAGEHRITSRAFDVHGNVQPPPDDPFLASKVTFWESNGQITRRVLIPA